MYRPKRFDVYEARAVRRYRTLCERGQTTTDRDWKDVAGQLLVAAGRHQQGRRRAELRAMALDSIGREVK